MSTSNEPNPPDRPPHDQTPHDQPRHDQGSSQGYGQPAASGYGQSGDQGYGQPGAAGHEDAGAAGHGGAPASPKNGLGITALIVAIIALIFCWLPVVGTVLAIVGLILGFVARGRVKRGQATNGGMALAAIVISALALIINIAVTAFAFFIGSQVQDCATLPVEEQQACIEDQLTS